MTMILAGTTDVVRYFMMRQVSDGTAFTGATIATFDLQYTRELTASATSDAGIVGTGGATTHVDNKVFELDSTNSPGLYMVCYEDAAFASGVDQVTLVLTYDSTVFTEAQNIQLVAFDPFAALATPTNITAGTIANVTTVNGLAANVITATSINAAAFTAVKFAASSLDGKGDWNIGKTGYALTTADWNVGKTGYSLTVAPLTAVEVNAEVDTALADINLDHFVGTASGIPALPAGTYLDLLQDDGTEVYDRSTDSLQAISDSGGGGLTSQQVRDAMKLAPTGGAPGSGSVDEHLDDIEADTAGLAGAVMRGTDGANTVVPPTVAQLNARTLLTASYFDPTADAVANVTLVATTTTNSDMVAEAPTAIVNADTLLDRDMSTGTDSGSASVRTVRQALRFLRNAWAIAGGTLTVNKEDDSTASWTATVTTDAGADPVIGSNPAD